MLDYFAIITTKNITMSIGEFLFYEIDPIQPSSNRVISKLQNSGDIPVPYSFTDRQPKIFISIANTFNIAQGYISKTITTPKIIVKSDVIFNRPSTIVGTM
jgi:hypothetical protein